MLNTERLKDSELTEVARKYERPISSGKNNKSRKSKDKKLRANLRKIDDQYSDAVKSAAATEYLLPERGGFLEAEDEIEKTFKVTQADIFDAVDVSTSNKALDLKLEQFGPYNANYSRNGTHLLVSGLKGHVASMDWRKGQLRAELHLNETVHAGTYLQSEQYFALAQKKYTFIYDHEGVELHRLKQHIDARHLEFLPYHYLLATAGTTGWLKYQDVSTGQLVSENRTKLGPTTAMTQNPWNAVMHLGHSNGTVTLWSPSMPEPLVKLLSARSPISSVAIDRSGNYMATAGKDKSLKVWDIRKFQELYTTETLPTPATNLSISDTGLLAASWGPHVSVWKDAFRQGKMGKPCFGSIHGNAHRNTPYMKHLFAGNRVNNMSFVPFEDLLGVGHQKGVTNLIIPGAGEANFDALEINPYETAKQRQEQEIRTLLNKLPADSISIDPNVIGTVDNRASNVRLTAKDVLQQQAMNIPGNVNDNDIPIARPDVKSKNSGLRSYLRKKTQNVIDERKLKVQKQLTSEKIMRHKIRKMKDGENISTEDDVVSEVLNRFS